MSNDRPGAAFGVIVIGTEILRGKREDRHVAHLRAVAAARGYELAYALVLADQTEQITAQLRWAYARPEPLFCYGGLGATPDDLTRACAAAAADLPLARHPEAAQLIRTRFGAGAEPVRIRMADLPAGAALIPNPVNQIPGFSLGKHHFFPGFPQMAQPMTQWVLEQHYPSRPARIEVRLLLPGSREGDLVPLMEAFVAAHPAVDFSSLPHFADSGPQIELGVAGEAAAVAMAAADLKQRLTAAGVPFRDL